MLRVVHLLFCFLLLLTLNLKAQTDTLFWFAVPEVTSDHGDRPIYLRMATLDQPANISVSIPANNNFTPINLAVAANSLETLDLTPFIDSLELDSQNTIENKGLLIESNTRISAYYEVLGSSQGFGVVNSDIFTLKGNNALGETFYTPFQNHWGNFPGLDAWSSIDIVATEDNTSITITLSTFGFPNIAANTPFTIVLNKGQTYSIRAIEQFAFFHMTGSFIEADKPIAVTIKDDSVVEGAAYDLVGDQIVPTDLIGTKYVLFSPNAITQTNKAFIVATEDNTKLYKNGSNNAIATLNKGESYTTDITSDIEYLESSFPIYVFHVTGLLNELGGALLPSIGECTGSPSVSLVRTSEFDFTAYILIEDGAQDGFLLDGSAAVVTENLFANVPGTNGEWVYAKITFPEDVLIPGNTYTLTNDEADFHLGIMMDENNFSFRYGYFSSFASGVELGETRAFCVGDSVTLDAGQGKDSYLWNTGAMTQEIVAKDSGLYSITATKGFCTFKDSVLVEWYPVAKEPLGYDDTSFCESVNYVLTTDTVFDKYMWSTGSNKSKIKPNTSGLYKVEVANEFGCINTDSVEVEIFPLPETNILYETDKDIFCENTTNTFTADPGFVEYLWNTGETTQSITSPHIFNYWVEVTDNNGCQFKKSIFTDCTLFITVPNTFTPNNDGINDYFLLDGLPGDGWTLTIFNRWGEQVYQKEAYDNSWQAEGEADGTYFYLLENKYNDTVYKGWVQVLR